MNKRRGLFFSWVPILFWMGLIYFLSSVPSLRVTEGLSDLILRKLAHMTEYAILFILSFRALRSTNSLSTRRNLIYALVISVLYAASDEYHQTFVPGRAGRIWDVAIDTAGVLGGLALALKKGFK
ncbi:MAG TPA: VanZ family protein [Patescibacteria group bacterium]|nr:VanZ family protein [Patescibacteria group bacterium]